MSDLRKIESMVQAFWVFIWIPLFVAFGADWCLHFPLPWGFLALVYGMFLPAIVWFFVLNPYLERDQRKSTNV